MRNASLNPPKRQIKLHTIKKHTNKDNNTNSSLITENESQIYQNRRLDQVKNTNETTKIAPKLSNNGQNQVILPRYTFSTTDKV